MNIDPFDIKGQDCHLNKVHVDHLQTNILHSLQSLVPVWNIYALQQYCTLIFVYIMAVTLTTTITNLHLLRHLHLSKKLNGLFFAMTTKVQRGTNEQPAFVKKSQ